MTFKRKTIERLAERAEQSTTALVTNAKKSWLRKKPVPYDILSYGAIVALSVAAGNKCKQKDYVGYEGISVLIAHAYEQLTPFWSLRHPLSNLVLINNWMSAIMDGSSDAWISIERHFRQTIRDGEKRDEFIAWLQNEIADLVDREQEWFVANIR